MVRPGLSGKKWHAGHMHDFRVGPRNGRNTYYEFWSMQESDAHHMAIKSSETNRYPNGPNCVAYEYDHGDEDISLAVVKIAGRYPEKGRVMNKVCKEVIYVTRGRGKVEIEGKEFPLTEGDSVLIKPDQRYFYEGKLDSVAVCCPAFYAEQHVRSD